MSADNVTTRPGARSDPDPNPSSTPRAGGDPATRATWTPAPRREPTSHNPSAAGGARPDETDATPVHREETSADPELSAAMSALLAQNWWAVAIRGAAAIVFGVLAFLMPGVTIASLVLLFSAYMLAEGVFAIVSGVRAARRRERWGLLVLEGLADIAAGVIAFVWPGITVLAFLALTAAWAVVSGGLMLGSAFRLQQTHGRWMLALGGAISVVWGVLLALAPIAGALVLAWWLRAYALVFGATLLGLAYRLHQRRPIAAAAAA